MRNRIRHRHNSLEPKDTLFITLHYRSPIRLRSLRILHVVEALGVSLPDIDFHAADSFAACVFDGAEHETGFSVWVMRDCASVGLVLGVGGVERAKDCAFGALGGFGVVDTVDEEGEAYHV